MSLQMALEVCGQLGGAAMLCEAQRAPLTLDCLSSQKGITSGLLEGVIPADVVRTREVLISLPEAELDQLCKQKRQSTVAGTSSE